MKTEKELNAAILNKLQEITETYPELVKYFGEMPVKTTDTIDHHVTLKNLRDYLDSLDKLMKKYALEQGFHGKK